MDMDESVKLIWNDVLEIVKRKYNDAKMSAWLSKLLPYAITDNTFTCAAQLQWPAGIVMRDYKTQVEECLKEITMEDLEFSVIVNPDLFDHPHEGAGAGAAGATAAPAGAPVQPQPMVQAQPVVQQQPIMQQPVQPVQQVQPVQPVQHMQPVQPQPVVTTHEPQAMTSTEEEMELRKRRSAQSLRTFDTFIVGDSNMIAFNSAQRVAEMPGRVFNPFFLYSKSGLGKTHLLLAIQNYINEYYPDKKTLYVTSEQFLQDYIKELADSKKKQSGQPIMTQYRNVDVLLVDDIQFLESKNESQEYFFATFEDLIKKGKQIVLSADRSPKDLKMDERMTSRFMSGLCQNIQPPGFELKLAILQSFYKRYSETEAWFQATISDELLRYIAEVSSSNIREIEGFLRKVMVEATNKYMNGATLTKNDIARYAAEVFEIQRKTIEISTIQREVEKRYGISHDDMIGSKRTKNINFPRQIAMYLCRELTDEVFAGIGKKFGGRDHTTIMNGVGNIEKRMKEDRTFYNDIEELKEIIRERS